MGTPNVLAGRYELRDVIAAGGVGTVWRGRDRVTGEPVAVKVLSDEAAGQPDVVAAFRDEARMLGEIGHPGVVRCRAFLPDALALVMDLVGGADLGRRLRATGPLSPGEAAEVLARVCAALAAVHAVGIVHGDIKPSNILVPDADVDGVKLADFGVAHRIQRPMEATHATPEYVAPEVVAGQPASPASDVYGVGLVLYEAMVGRSPYRGGTVEEVLNRHTRCELVPVPGIPDTLWVMVERCLALAPDRRPTATELAVTLRALAPKLAELPAVRLAADAPLYRPRSAPALVGLDELLTAPVAASAQVPAQRSGRDRKVVAGAVGAAVVLAAVIGVGGWLAYGGSRHETVAEHKQPRTTASASARPHRSPSTAPTDPASPSPAESQPAASSQPSAPPTEPAESPAPTTGTGGDPGVGDPMPTLPGHGG